MTPLQILLVLILVGVSYGIGYSVGAQTGIYLLYKKLSKIGEGNNQEECENNG